MATFKTYAGEEITVAAERVQEVSAYNFFDHDMKLPAKFMIKNGDGLDEVTNDPDLKAEADALRTSERTLILMTNGGSHEVQGTVDEVNKALKATPKRS